jgi:hypothetical protein
MIKIAIMQEQLPDVALEIADLIGYDKALLLFESLGGRDFPVPVGNRPSDNKAMLVTAIGDKAANTFMAHYGGERLYIPRCKNALTKIRDYKFCDDIATAIANGKTKTSAIQIIALKHGISERWGYKLLSKASKENAIQARLTP